MDLINKYLKLIPRIEAEILLAHILKYSRTELHCGNIEIDEGIEDLCDSFIERRLSGEPIQYITGRAEFMDFEFIVDKHVFIPRPETELLVNEILRTPNSQRLTPNTSLTILDLCTGCGNIAISLAKLLLPQVEIVATDISEHALDIANKNSTFHSVDTKIKFHKGDLFKVLLPFDNRYKFDIIVCNPPYIKTSELDFLQKEVRCEPALALDGGMDGLDFYRRIAKDAPFYLKRKGSIFLEIGFDQANDVKKIFSSSNKFEILNVTRDFAHIERVLWTGLL